MGPREVAALVVALVVLVMPVVREVLVVLVALVALVVLVVLVLLVVLVVLVVLLALEVLVERTFSTTFSNCLALPLTFSNVLTLSQTYLCSEGVLLFDKKLYFKASQKSWNKYKFAIARGRSSSPGGSTSARIWTRTRTRIA